MTKAGAFYAVIDKRTASIPNYVARMTTRQCLKALYGAAAKLGRWAFRLSQKVIGTFAGGMGLTAVGAALKRGTLAGVITAERQQLPPSRDGRLYTHNLYAFKADFLAEVEAVYRSSRSGEQHNPCLYSSQKNAPNTTGARNTNRTWQSQVDPDAVASDIERRRAEYAAKKKPG